MRERLAFGGIHHDNRRATLVGESAYRPPLTVGGEPGSAPPEEPAALDDIQQPFPADRPPAESRPVVGEALWPVLEAGSRQQPETVSPLREQVRGHGCRVHQRRRHQSGPDATIRPLIDGAVP